MFIPTIYIVFYCFNILSLTTDVSYDAKDSVSIISLRGQLNANLYKLYLESPIFFVIELIVMISLSLKRTKHEHLLIKFFEHVKYSFILWINLDLVAFLNLHY